MRVVKIIALVSALVACHAVQALMDPLVESFYAEVSKAGMVGVPFDVASLDRILSPEFILNDGSVVRSQSELKLFFAELKKRVGQWTILPMFSLSVSDKEARARIFFLWSVPGAKDLVVDAHIYSSAGKQLDKMVARVVFKDTYLAAITKGFVDRIMCNGLGGLISLRSGKVTCSDGFTTFHPLTKQLTTKCVVDNGEGQVHDFAFSMCEHPQETSKKSV